MLSLHLLKGSHNFYFLFCLCSVSHGHLSLNIFFKNVFYSIFYVYVAIFYIYLFVNFFFLFWGANSSASLFCLTFCVCSSRLGKTATLCKLEGMDCFSCYSLLSLSLSFVVWKWFSQPLVLLRRNCSLNRYNIVCSVEVVSTGSFYITILD